MAFCGILCAGAWWFLSNLDVSNPKTKFSYSFPLQQGKKVIVSGITDTDFQGDTATQYQIALENPDQTHEVVSQDKLLFNVGAPTGPFQFSSTPTHLFLASNSEIYNRSRSEKTWRTWKPLEDPELPYLGRALMPDRYAYNETFESNYPDQTGHDNLPRIPDYNFERWDLPRQIVIMRQNFGEAAAAANDSDSPLWPQRLLFHQRRLDLEKTLALNLKWKLRALPKKVKVEVLKMKFADDFAWNQHITVTRNGSDFYRFDQVAKLPNSQVLGRDQFVLSQKFHATPLASWWNQKGATKVQIRGFCGDPNANLLHFLWKIGDEQHWEIAHNGEWRPIRESGGVLEAPYLFVRFSWPKRQTKAQP